MVDTIGPSTVRTLGDSISVRYPFQRKGFYAKGYHYAFYLSNSYLCYKSSSDGENWGDEHQIRTASDGAEFSVWLDRSEEPAEHISWVYAEEDQDGPLIYRWGFINGPAEGDGPGTIAWDVAGEEIAVEFEVGYSYKNVTICVSDTGGFPFIGYTKTKRSNNDSIPYVTSSTTKDTWTERSGFPKDLSAVNDDSWICVVVPWEDNIFALYARDNNLIKYDYYEIGGAWAGEQDTGISMGGDATKLSVTSQRPGAAPAQDPKRVHVAFCSGDEDLSHFRVDVGDIITGPTIIYASTPAMGPAISTRIFGGDVNHYRTLYVYWTPIAAEPRADYVCYKKSADAGATWTNEAGGDAVDEWIDETRNGLSGVNIASSYFEEQHHATLPESYLGLLYTNLGASPDYVRFAGLEFADPDEDLLGRAVIRHPDTAELLGRFEAQAIVELLGNFEVQHSGSAELLGRAAIRHPSSAELLGRAAIRHPSSAELLGRFEAQATAELLGKFDVGQDSSELLGRAAIRHPDTAELLGRFEAQATAELLGRAAIRHPGSAELLGRDIVRNVGSAELLGRAAIRHPDTAELLGRAAIRHPDTAEFLGRAVIRHPGSAELLGNFEVGQGSAELLGRFEAQVTAELLGRAAIRHPDSAELTGRFRMNSPYWLIQGVSVEAYITKSIIA